MYGPEEWANVSNVCGTGENQSPVNIKIDPSKPAKRNNANNKSEWSNANNTGKPLVEYDTRDGVLFGNLTNNGHSPTFAVTKGKSDSLGRDESRYFSYGITIYYRFY